MNNVLRIPVPRSRWEEWIQGNPTKLIRYWKFIGRGFKPVDFNTHEFMVKSAITMIGSALPKMDCRSSYSIMKGNDRNTFREALITDLGRDIFSKYFDNNN